MTAQEAQINIPKIEQKINMTNEVNKNINLMKTGPPELIKA